MSEKKKKKQQETKQQETKTPVSEKEEKQFTVRSWARRARLENGRVVEGTESEDDDIITVRDFVVPACFVRRSFGLTMKLADYESARVDVGISIPCYREELNEADKLARDWCEQKIEAEVKEVRKAQEGDAKAVEKPSTKSSGDGSGPLL